MDRAFVSQSDNCEASFRLRPMKPADVADLSDLWVAAWRETLPDIDFEARRAWLATFLAEPACTTIVIETGSRPLGFVTLEAAFVHQLVVAPEAKGGGVAGALLAGAKARAPDGLRLEVNQANTRAVRFYEREGFAIEAAARNPTSGLPTWRMAWRPPSPLGVVA